MVVEYQPGRFIKRSGNESCNNHYHTTKEDAEKCNNLHETKVRRID